jgi:ppGpp synthetase/RelA/SpoT-type nucleotidyltranferase
MSISKQNKNTHTKKLLRDYANKHELYGDFSASIRRLLLLFLKTENISFHSIFFRAKDVYSLKQKIKRKILAGLAYRGLMDINDLAGVRIILYYKSDISKVMKILNQEFTVEHIDDYYDRKGSNGLKKKSGYRSTHVVISMNEERQKMKEYVHFKDLKCEVQIRTILQNAWAEIEHGIGYKPSFNIKNSVNKEIRRTFQLAARRLELVDDIFVKAHDLHAKMLDKYAKRLKKRELNFPISYESVESYLLKKTAYQLIPEAKKSLLTDQYLKLAEENHLSTIQELDGLIAEKEKNKKIVN